MAKFVAQPTNPSEGEAVKFDSLDKAIRYCSAAYTLGIRAVVLNDRGEVLHRNYPIYTMAPTWV